MIGMILALAQAVAAPSPSPPVTLQAQFERANAAFEARQWQAALDGFSAIEARPGAAQRSIGIARLRKGIALANANRSDEAIITLSSGLDLTAQHDDALVEMRGAAALALGDLAHAQYDNVAARRALETVLRETNDAGYVLAALLGLIDVTMFDDPKAALEYADQAIRIADARAGKDIVAQAHDRRGRVLLNGDDLTGALAEFQIALKAAGGVTSRSDTNDVVIRSDLAIANLLSKNEKAARDLLAMTGAGRLPDQQFVRAAQMDLPPCSENLHPEDVAVIQLSVGEDGSVRDATPVYASRRGMPVLDMARAVHSWVWRPDEIAKIPAFFRTATRIELRCSAAAEKPVVVRLLSDEVRDWLFVAQAKKPIPLKEKLVTLADFREAIAQAANEPRLLLILLTALSTHPQADQAERAEALDKAIDVAQAEHAPPAALAWLYVTQAGTATRFARSKFVADLLRDAQGTEFAGDAKSRAVLVLSAHDMTNNRLAPEMIEAIRGVANDPRLDEHDPLRVGALVRLSSLQARAGDMEQARKTYLGTGLNAQQCALVDVSPVRLRGGAQESDVPPEAMDLGISGWAATEFDIRADGTTTNIRTVAAYPPFVYGEPMRAVTARSRYTQSYRPEGGLGCGGYQTTQAFHVIS